MLLLLLLLAEPGLAAALLAVKVALAVGNTEQRNKLACGLRQNTGF